MKILLVNSLYHPQELGGAELYAPEAKSLTEVVELSGCGGVKFRRREALCVERRGLGDEGRGAVCEGPLRSSD